MICDISDKNGAVITIGSAVEVNQSWLKVPTTRVGIVREVIFRAGCDPMLKVSGVRNRNLTADDVTVLDLSKGEQSLVNAFVDNGVTPDINVIHDIIHDVKAECIEEIIVNGDLDDPAF